jgi:hypothetical protein
MSLGFGFIPDMLMGKKPKDALKDNLKTAALVGAGIYAAPLLGAGAAGGAASGGGLLSMLSPTAGAPAAGSGAGGMLGSLGSYIKPVSDAVGMASQVNQLMSKPQIQAPMMQQPHAGGQDPIGGLLAQQMQLEEMRRRARGGYGAA